MPHRLILCYCSILLLCLSTFASACQQPNLRCLRKHIQLQANQLQITEVDLSEPALLHWQFEIQTPLPDTSDTEPPDSLHHKLKQEERLIHLLHRGELETAQGLANQLLLPFHDLFAADGQQLLMQQLILQLQDQRAEKIKRNQLERHWQSGKPPNHQLLQIARHEILGGDPLKGLATLSNADIDGFSDITESIEQKHLSALGHQAEKLFLDPTAAQRNCTDNTALALGSVQQFFSPNSFNLMRTLWNTPHAEQAWKAQLTLALLHQNAGSCRLLVNLHRNQVIMSALEFHAKNERDFISLVYALRTIRRYLDH